MTILERLKALPKNILEKLQSLRQTIGNKLIKAVSYVFNVKPIFEVKASKKK
jgi:hypothetical protein